MDPERERERESMLAKRDIKNEYARERASEREKRSDCYRGRACRDVR